MSNDFMLFGIWLAIQESLQEAYQAQRAACRQQWFIHHPELTREGLKSKGIE
jgi:hypothetical protein